MEEKKSTRSEALKRAQAKYRSTRTRQKSLQFYINTDADILAFIDTLDNFSGYIKSLIRADMKAKGITPDTSTVAPQLPPVHPGLAYSDPDGTYKVLRVNGNDVMIESEDGKKYATTVQEIEQYL